MELRGEELRFTPTGVTVTDQFGGVYYYGITNEEQRAAIGRALRGSDPLHSSMSQMRPLDGEQARLPGGESGRQSLLELLDETD